jgi:hypothetical protein
MADVMKSTSTRRLGVLRAMLLASTLSIAITEAREWILIGHGFSPTDDPSSPAYVGEIAPPSWQGRPYAIRSDNGRR